MDVPFAIPLERVDYQAKSSAVIDRVWEKNSVSKDPTMSHRCGPDSFSDGWFASNQKYSSKDLDCDALLYQYAGEYHKLYVVQHNVEESSIPLLHCS